MMDIAEHNVFHKRTKGKMSGDLELADNPGFKIKIVKMLDKYFQEKKDISGKIDNRMRELFAETFPDDPYVKKWKQGYYKNQYALDTRIKSVMKIVDLSDYLDVFGLTDGFIFKELKKNIESSDRRVSNTAITLVLKMKKYLYDGRPLAQTINIQNNKNTINRPVFIRGETKKEAMRELMKNYEELKKYAAEEDNLQ